MSNNPIVYSAARYDELIARLKEMGITHIHLTNGSFTRGDQETIRETRLTTAAGMSFIAEAKLREFAPDAKHAFLVGVHGTQNLKVYAKKNGQEVPKFESIVTRAKRFIPQVDAYMRETFDIPVLAAAFEDRSTPTAFAEFERQLHEAGFTLGYAYKFGDWGLGKNPTVFNKNVKGALTFPYSKVPVQANSSVFDQEDKMSQLRHIRGLQSFHRNGENFYPGTSDNIQEVDLFSDKNEIGHALLERRNDRTYPLFNPRHLELTP